MHARFKKRKLALILLMATSIAVNGLGQIGQAAGCASATTVDSSSCSEAGCCCSRDGNKVKACCCCAKRTPTPQAPQPGANKFQLDQKLAPWAQPALPVASEAVSRSEMTFSEGRFFSPLRPSVQLRLCIWRI
jgi:hypothetical protein